MESGGVGQNPNRLVNGGSVADQAGLMAGDALIKVNGTEVFNMRHKEAQDVIVAAGNSFELTVSRGGATWRPSVTPTGSLPSPSPSLPGNITPVTRTSLAATPQEMKPIGSGHNTAAKPFAAVNGNDGQIKSIVNNQYNTPVGMYSDETIAETLSSQAEVLAGGVLGVNFKKNERVYSPANSEVYKLLHEQGDDPEPAQQQQQQQQPQQQYQQQQQPQSPHHLSNSGSGTNTVTRHVSAPVDRPVAPAANGLPPGQNICASCERLIVHAIGGYATAGRLPVGSLVPGARPRGPSPLPPQMQGQVPRPPMPKPPMMQPQPQRPAPQAAPNQQAAPPKVAFPPQQQQQQQQQAPAPAPAPGSAFRPAPNTAPRSGIPPKVHSDGVFVRIKDKNLHADCFKCATCGTSLKNQGYFNLNDKLYCDIHARLAALNSPPPGTNGMVPVAVTKPGHKTGVSAISAALNAHANLNGRSQSPYGNNTITVGQSPSHSRSSSTTSSSGYCNSSSLSPVQSNKVSPLHSRTSSENELIDRSHSSNSNSSSTFELTGPIAFPACPSSPLPPPPPPLPPMEENTAQLVQPEAANGSAEPQLVFGANGLAAPAPPDGETQPDAGGSESGTVTQNEFGFYYQTMGGRVIRSVLPPGKNSTYKVNQNNITPKPFGAPLPVSPLAQVQPPASYPPVAGSVPTPFSAALVGAQAPAPAPVAAPAPAPMAAPAAPLAAPAPAMAPAPVPTPQEKDGSEETPAEAEEKAGEEEEDAGRERSESPAPVFAWPPKPEVVDTIPTATPIYIPPPETQRVIIKPITVVPPMKVKEKSKTPPDGPQEQQSKQSKSAPELSHRAGQEDHHQQQQQQDEEDLSESYGMTTTTTTTTANSASSEEYRMYQTQTSQPIVTYYETPQYELENPFSSGQRSAQASTGAMSDASYTHFVFRDPPPEEEEEEEAIVEEPPEVQPVAGSTATATDTDRPAKRVEFVDYGRELERYVRAEQEKEARRRALEAEMAEAAKRPEEPPHYSLPSIPSAEPPQLPPSAIPNPTPKQWQSALVQALCVAPPDPIHLTADQIEEANFMRSRNEAYRREQEETKMRQLEALRRQVDALERRLGKQPEPEPEPLPVGPPLEVPRKGEVMAKLLATSTTRSQRFPAHYVPVVPLPAETEPYFPPPHSMEPIRSEKISSMRNESPFVEALKTAPYTPFQQFGREIPSQMEDLPVPSGRLSMMDALATAPERPYTPFSEVRFDRSSEVYQEMVREQPSVPVDPDRQCSAFANVGGNRTPKPFVPIVPEIREIPPEPTPKEERSPEKASESSRRSSTRVAAVPKVISTEETRRCSQTVAQTVESRRSSTATVESRRAESGGQDSRRGSGGTGSEPTPPKSATSKPETIPPYPGRDSHPPEHYSLALRRETSSPLNKPAEIPPYQRKWFNLPTQNPPRTPEPEELRTNVPLAFVNTHSHTANLSKPIAKPPGPVNKPPAPYTTIQNRTIPVVQPQPPELDAELAQYHSAHARLQHKGVIDRGQSFTPSLILTKHATTIPYYQHQLGFEEYFAEVKEFDGHTTPQPSRTKSPAFGPPPNPLKPHVPPSREGIPVESGLYLSMGKLHGVPWYANKDHVPADIQKKMQEQLHLEATQRYGRSVQQHHQEVTSHQQVTMSSSSSVTTSEQHQQQQQQQRMSREQASAERAVQSAQQVGNALIQKRTRFVEEHESSSRSQSVSRNANSESSRYSSKIKEDEAPQKGFVAQQTRRFSGQDEALNIPPQPTEQELKQQQQQQQEQEQAALIQQLQEEQQKRQIAAAAKPAPPPAPIRHVEPPTPKPAPPPTHFPETDLFAEEFVDHFPSISARKASVLLPPKPAVGRSDCVSPSSFKAQFNEFMIGAGPMPPMPPMREEDEGKPADDRSDTQKLIQSWPPQLPPQVTAPVAVATNTNAPPANGAAPPTPGSKPSSRSNSTAFLDFLNRPTFNPNTDRSTVGAGTNSFNKGRAACSTSAPNRGRGVMNKAVGPGGRVPLCGCCQQQIRSPGQRIEEVDYATMLLDSSVSKLACMNNNADYRKQASNVVKDMLEARLRKTDANVRAKNKENLHSNGSHTPSLARTPVFPLGSTNGKTDDIKPVPPYMNGSNVVPSKAAAAFNGTHTNGQHDLTVYPVQTTVPSLAADLGKVILRQKNHNAADVNGSQAPINGRKVSSELTSHARDRRSYVERNNNLAPYDKKQAQQEIATPQEQDPVANGSALALLKDKIPICNVCDHKIVTGPFITALGRIWCPDHFICHNANCKRPLADIGFVEEKGDLYCEYCFEEFLAPLCSKCNGRVKGDCLNAIGKQFHPECFKCTYCGKQFGNSPFFLEEGDPYCEKDWNDLFTTKCFACGFPVEAGDKWVEALNNNYHSQCFNCTSCKKNLEGQSFFAKGGRPFCKNHAR
uniref:PDZ domain-containing protein n=1 Tax=Anopheles stephensi TaxID=30069 RepID=A0A182Y810_ANOST